LQTNVKPLRYFFVNNVGGSCMSYFSGVKYMCVRRSVILCMQSVEVLFMMAL